MDQIIRKFMATEDYTIIFSHDLTDVFYNLPTIRQ